MSKKRRTFSRDFKAKIALEDLQENLTISLTFLENIFQNGTENRYTVL